MTSILILRTAASQDNDDAHVKINIALAFGDVEAAERSPFVAGALAFVLFAVGAVPSVIPFAITDDTTTAIIAAFIVTLVCILLVGGIKTYATKSNLFVSAFENLIITAGGGGIAYGIGVAFEKLVQ